MAKRQHIIELNGKKYDALTGTIVTESSAHKAAAKTPKPTKHTPKHVDGFVRKPHAVAAKLQSASSSPKTVHKQPAKSQTLMRSAVKKPASQKIHAKATAVSAATQVAQPADSSLFGSIKPGRAIRANHIGKSKLISRFGASTPTVKTEVVPVKPAPVTSAPTVVAKPLAHHTKALAPTHDTKKTKPAAKPDPFKAAVQNAVAPKHHKVKKPRIHHRIAKKLRVSPRLVSLAGVTIMALGVGGFLAYQNLPELAMRVASTRAGLSASLPSYQPAGFSMAGPIEYEPGAVTVNYKSNSDDRSFNVTQKNSSWNSEALLENYVSPTKQPYQTFQAKGRTIYIYEGNKATWVDGGVWFNVDGKTNLNSDQLLRIAESL